jgi:hypothetical protein
MKQFKPVAFSIVGVGLGLLLAYLLGIAKPKYEIDGKDVSWLFDKTKAKVEVERNYLFATRLGGGPISVLGEVSSTEGINALSYLKAYTDTCKSFTKSRTYCIGYSIRELETYFANLKQITTIDSFRIYFGMYPNTAGVDKADRLTGHLVAVGTDKLEKYNDATPGYKIINLGTLCPTACPPAGATDPNSLYHKAGRP